MRKQILAALAVLILPALAVAENGTLKGTIRHAVSGQGLGGAGVSLTQTSKQEQAEVRYQTTAKDDGSYEVPGVAPGSYAVIVVYPGLKPGAKPGVSIQNDQALVLDFSLSGD